MKSSRGCALILVALCMLFRPASAQPEKVVEADHLKTILLKKGVIPQEASIGFSEYAVCNKVTLSLWISTEIDPYGQGILSYWKDKGTEKTSVVARTGDTLLDYPGEKYYFLGSPKCHGNTSFFYADSEGEFSRGSGIYFGMPGNVRTLVRNGDLDQNKTAVYVNGVFNPDPRGHTVVFKGWDGSSAGAEGIYTTTSLEATSRKINRIWKSATGEMLGTPQVYDGRVVFLATKPRRQSVIYHWEAAGWSQPVHAHFSNGRSFHCTHRSEIAYNGKEVFCQAFLGKEYGIYAVSIPDGIVRKVTENFIVGDALASSMSANSNLLVVLFYRYGETLLGKYALDGSLMGKIRSDLGVQLDSPQVLRTSLYYFRRTAEGEAIFRLSK